MAGVGAGVLNRNGIDCLIEEINGLRNGFFHEDGDGGRNEEGQAMARTFRRAIDGAVALLKDRATLTEDQWLQVSKEAIKAACDGPREGPQAVFSEARFGLGVTEQEIQKVFRSVVDAQKAAGIRSNGR